MPRLERRTHQAYRGPPAVVVMAKGESQFRYRCPDCGTVKEFPQRPAMTPTCCGHAMDEIA